LITYKEIYNLCFIWKNTEKF